MTDNELRATKADYRDELRRMLDRFIESGHVKGKAGCHLRDAIERLPALPADTERVIDLVERAMLKEQELLEAHAAGKVYSVADKRRNYVESVAADFLSCRAAGGPEDLMTDNELRAAAEKIADNIECASQVHWQSDSHRDDAIRNIEAGLKTLVAHPTAAPDDADEPITEEWLRSVGFTEDEEEYGKYGLGISRRKSYGEDTMTFKLIAADFPNLLECCWEVRSRSIEVEEEGCLIPCEPQTRGELRRLCSALGIPLEKP